MEIASTGQLPINSIQTSSDNLNNHKVESNSNHNTSPSNHVNHDAPIGQQVRMTA